MSVTYKPESVLQAAIAVANQAGYDWIGKVTGYSAEQLDANPSLIRGVMLDACGNSHLKFRDKRSAHYKAFKAAGLVRESTGTVLLWHKWKERQDIGLQMACTAAAGAFMAAQGVEDLTTWTYLD